MFSALRKKIFASHKAVGIEITFIGDGLYIINCIALQVKNARIITVGKWYNLTSISQLQNKFPNSIPVSLVINGKGIIHKKVTPDFDMNSSNIFPGVNQNDFLFDKYTDNSITDIAVVRKSSVESLISEFQKLGIIVVDISLAFYDIKFILPLINHNDSLDTTQYWLDLKNRNLINYRSTTENEKEKVVKEDICLGSEYINSNFLIAYGTAVKLLTHNNQLSQHDFKVVKENRVSIRQNLVIKLSYVIILVGFFLLLLTNFLTYNNYFNQNNRLIANYHMSLAQSSRTDSARLKAKEKLKYLEAAGWLNNKGTISYYADRIASTIPDSIILTSMNINPAFLKSSLNSKQWNFQQDTILITGTCNDPSLLDSWEEGLQEIKNVSKAKILSYYLKKENESGTFTAEVITK